MSHSCKNQLCEDDHAVQHPAECICAGCHEVEHHWSQWHVYPLCPECEAEMNAYIEELMPSAIRVKWRRL